MTQQDAVKAAVKAAGGPMKVALEFGMGTDATVRHWVRAGHVPASKVKRLIKLSGLEIAPEVIRPDVFGEPE